MQTSSRPLAFGNASRLFLFHSRLYGFKIHHLAYQIQQQAAANFKAPMRTMSYNSGKR